MKVLHFADLHLGVDNYSRLDPETGFSTCFQDFLRSLDQAVDYAVDTNVDLVLFCGDAFKTRYPTPTDQTEFSKRIMRLAQARIPIFLLTGNHDTPGTRFKATSLDIYQTLSMPLITVANCLGTYVIPTKSGDIQIVAVPWFSRARMDTLRDPEVDAPDVSIPAAFKQMLQSEIDKLDPDIPAIMAAHAHVSGALAGSELALTISGDPIFHPDDLARPPILYVALGHIHKMQEMPCDIPVIYPGSVQRLDFGEERESKGFYVLGIEPGRVSYGFMELAARNFLTIDVTVPGGDPNPTETALCAIAEKPTTGAIVRLRIDIDETDRARLHESALYYALKGAQYVRIEKQIRRQHRTRVNGSVGSAAPLDMLGRYLDSKGTPRDFSEALIKQATILMKEVME